MKTESFDNFRKKYINSLEEEETIKFLLDNDIRNYIIENDDYNFLALIASSNNDELRSFYFNEQTIPYIVQLNKFLKVLKGSYMIPNKIKLFDNEVFIKYLTLNTSYPIILENIETELLNIKFFKQQDYSDSITILKTRYYNLLHFLQQDFINNLSKISILMKRIPSELYKEFLDYILNDLKQVAIKNKELLFDEIFSNSFITCSNIAFEDVERIINNFKGIDNLYYSPSLLYSLINKSTDYKGLIINEEELNRLKDYIFNDYGKKIFLMNFNYSSIEKLYMCFSDEVIDYLLDDDGLIILENNSKFDQLFYNDIASNDVAYDKLTKSHVFAKLLQKNYPKPKDYDERIDKLGKSLIDNESFFNLLDIYIELKDYNHFFRIFTKLSANNQLIYFKKNEKKLLKLNNNEIFKGMKKELYEIYKNNLNIKNWKFTEYDLYNILKNKQNYSEEQLKYIFSNKENVTTIINGEYTENTYEMILNLNIPKLNKIYMSKEVLTFLRNKEIVYSSRKTNKLDGIYHIINKLEIDASPLLLDTDCLIDVGEEIEDEYKKERAKGYKIPIGSYYHCTYHWFLSEIPQLKNLDTLFKILDFYLINKKYLSTFYILKRRLKDEVLQEYLSSRQDIITKLIQEELITKIIQNNDDLSLILGKVPNNIEITEIFKELITDNNDFRTKLLKQSKT